jgi:hypothetical protein
VTSESPTLEAYERHRVLFWIGGFFGCLIIGLFIASFFFDDIIRARTQAAMNQKLTGYHVALDHAHLQLLGGILTLKGLRVIQQAHPHPPVADIAKLRFHIQLKELFSRRIVADVLLHRPRVHIDQTQFVSEKNSIGQRHLLLISADRLSSSPIPSAAASETKGSTECRCPAPPGCCWSPAPTVPTGRRFSLQP